MAEPRTVSPNAATMTAVVIFALGASCGTVTADPPADGSAPGSGGDRVGVSSGQGGAAGSAGQPSGGSAGPPCPSGLFRAVDGGLVCVTITATGGIPGTGNTTGSGNTTGVGNTTGTGNTSGGSGGITGASACSSGQFAASCLDGQSCYFTPSMGTVCYGDPSCDTGSSCLNPRTGAACPPGYSCTNGSLQMTPPELGVIPDSPDPDQSGAASGPETCVCVAKVQRNGIYCAIGVTCRG